MTTTRLVGRTRLSEMMGDWIDALVVDSSTGTTNITDAALEDLGGDGYFEGFYVVFPSGPTGSGSFEIRRVSAFTSSGGVLTLRTAASGSIGTVSYELHRYDPAQKHNALNRSLEDHFPDLYNRVEDIIMVDNLLANPSFETSESTGSITAFADYDSTVEGATQVTDASHGLSTGDLITISGTTNYNGTFPIVVISTSTFYILTQFIADDATGTWVEGAVGQEGTASGWTASSGTWTFPASIRRVHGRHIASATGAATLTQNLFNIINVSQAQGRTLHLRAWVWASAANIARLRVTFNGTTYTSGSFHAGNDEWENPNQQWVTATIPAGATEATCVLDIASGGTAYFDLVGAFVDRVYEYALPVSFVRDPHQVLMQRELTRPNGAYDRVNKENPIRRGLLLYIVGKGLLTQLSDEPVATELAAPEIAILYAYALEWLARSLWSSLGTQGRERFAADREEWKKMAVELRGEGGLRLPRIPANRRDDGGWRVLRSGTDAPRLLFSAHGGG